MTAAEYTALRASKGTQKEVARLLGISERTILRREAGESPITREMVIALQNLPVIKIVEKAVVFP